MRACTLAARFVRQMSAIATNVRVTSGNRLELIVSSTVLIPAKTLRWKSTLGMYSPRRNSFIVVVSRETEPNERQSHIIWRDISDFT